RTMSEAVAAPPAVTLTRTYPVPRERVFAAWTDPALITQWFFPAPGFHNEPTIDARPGGDYRIVMNHPSGKNMVVRGTYRALAPRSKLVFTWEWEDGRDADGSVVTVELLDLGNSPELRLTHELLQTEQSREEHERGWIGCLQNFHTFIDPASAPAAPQVQTA